jgi:hypothetical protein
MKPELLVHFKVLENNQERDGSILLPRMPNIKATIEAVQKHATKGKPFILLSISKVPGNRGDVVLTSGVRKLLTEALNKIRHDIKDDLKNGASELSIQQKQEDKTVLEKLLS